MLKQYRCKGTMSSFNISFDPWSVLGCRGRTKRLCARHPSILYQWHNWVCMLYKHFFHWSHVIVTVFCHLLWTSSHSDLVKETDQYTFALIWRSFWKHPLIFCILPRTRRQFGLCFGGVWDPGKCINSLGLHNDSALTKKAIQAEQIYMQAANIGQTHCLFCFSHITEHVCSDSHHVCG